MPDQPADPLHYEMKIPPKKQPPDAGNDSNQARTDQSRTESPQPDSAGKANDAEGNQAAPRTKHP